MILVTDATGRIGSSVARQLVAAGQHVRAFVPSIARASRLDVGRTGLAVGSLTDQRALTRALDGVSVVVLIASGSPENIAAQEQLIALAGAADVERIIKLSTIGAGTEACCESARVHGRIEQLLAESGIPSCSVRAARLMQSLELQVPLILTAGILTGCQGDGRVADIDLYDVAAVLTAIALRDDGRFFDDSLHGVDRSADAAGTVFEAVDITGPTALTRAEVARLLEQNLSRDVSYVDCDPNELLQCAQVAGMPSWQAQDIVGFETAARDGHFQQTSGAVQAILGRAPRDFASFAHEFAFSVRYAQAPGMLDSTSPALMTT